MQTEQPIKSWFGTPEFNKLPNGPAKFAGTGRNPNPSVSAFSVKVPIHGTPINILATCYGRKDPDTGDIVFSITMPGMGMGRTVLATNDAVRAQFRDHVESAAAAWALFDECVDKAIDTLSGSSASGKLLNRLVRRASDGSAQIVAAITPSGEVVKPTGPNAGHAGKR